MSFFLKKFIKFDYNIKSLKDNVNDAIELGEGSVQSKEIRADIFQLRQEVKELTKLLKSQTS